MLGDDYAYHQELIVSDLWARVNTQILAEIHKRESDDRNHFSRMRASREKRKK